MEYRCNQVGMMQVPMAYNNQIDVLNMFLNFNDK